ncbi:MAG: hypothetical protein AAGD00_10010 [Planctomycetota bacterium]
MKRTIATIGLLGVCAMTLLVTGCSKKTVSVGTAAQPPLVDLETRRFELSGIAMEYAPSIDRVTFFGPAPDGPNLLHVRDLDIPPAEDGSYRFYGGGYSWYAPQKQWVGEDGSTIQEWPPDPAMDRGPAETIAHSATTITVRNPVQWSGLQQKKTLGVSGPARAEVTYTLTNRGNVSRQAGTWINTGVFKRSLIAVRVPEGAEIYGWNDTAADTLRSIMSEPMPGDDGEPTDWRFIDLKKATWQGGIKVWIDAPGIEPEIAVYDDGYWFRRRVTTPNDGSARAAGEGAVAIYIDPGAGLVEAELYGPVRTLTPGESVTTIESWAIRRAPHARAWLIP